MTEKDVEYFKQCHAAKLVSGRMLEVGSAKVQGVPNLCEIAHGLGVGETLGVDMQPFDGVDAVFDFGIRPEEFRASWRLGTFSTVCVFNVLEHTFDPITVLTNALSCLRRNGNLLVVTPSVWPIHSYPGDFSRLLPDWYRSFAERHSLRLVEAHFCWLSEFGIEKIGDEAEPSLPAFQYRKREASKSRYWASRIGHKLLNTYGRSHWATHSAIGAAFTATANTAN
jgi:SAM-dependent methyltransferase